MRKAPDGDDWEKSRWGFNGFNGILYLVVLPRSNRFHKPITFINMLR